MNILVYLLLSVLGSQNVTDINPSVSADTIYFDNWQSRNRGTGINSDITYPKYKHGDAQLLLDLSAIPAYKDELGLPAGAKIHGAVLVELVVSSDGKAAVRSIELGGFDEFISTEKRENILRQYKEIIEAAEWLPATKHGKPIVSISKLKFYLALQG